MVLGHLTFVEGMVPTVLFGNPNPVAEWQKYFGENSEPVGNANAYPTFARVRTKYLELRDQNLEILASLGILSDQACG